nr:G2/mitotic-specific cyclin S13-7-like [Tanacetum cinerariifolium]
NIDESDINNELAEVEYVEEIYAFYKDLESEGGLRDYMDSQPDITAYLRATLIDWLIEVHIEFDMRPESLYLAINIIDRYISVKTVLISELKLLSITALLLSSKYEELRPMEEDDDLVNVNSMSYISDNTYSSDQILAMESDILSHLSWCLTVPTPYMFTVRYIKASLPPDNEVVNMTFFFTELGLMDYLVTISNNPSKLAASVVYAARCTLNKTPAWTETLRHYTGYAEDQIRDCAKILVSFHACASESKFKEVYEKYVNPDRGAVALFPPATTVLPKLRPTCTDVQGERAVADVSGNPENIVTQVYMNESCAVTPYNICEAKRYKGLHQRLNLKG